MYLTIAGEFNPQAHNGIGSIHASHITIFQMPTYDNGHASRRDNPFYVRISGEQALLRARVIVRHDEGAPAEDVKTYAGLHKLVPIHTGHRDTLEQSSFNHAYIHAKGLFSAYQAR